MNECFQIKSAEELIKLLEKDGKKPPLYDFDYQLQTNYGFVFNLADNKVIFLPNNFRDNGLIFENKKCFQEVLDSDEFPLENPERTLYDTEIEGIKRINEQIGFYHSYLNTILKLDYSEINQEAAHSYLKKIIGRTIKKITTHKDIIALIAVFGELIRKEVNGNWVIEKWYGTYNPHFKPRILNSKKRLIFVDDIILSQIKWKVSDIQYILGSAQVKEGLILMSKRSKHHECIILGN
jgi:hypothetical protein